MFAWLVPAPVYATLADILRTVRRIERITRSTMTAVQVQQEDIDATAATLEGLVDVLNGVDLTPLPAADQSKLIAAVADVTDAANRIAGVTVPTPNPEPEPSETVPAAPAADESASAEGE